MALKLNTQYPGRFDPVSTDYPQGKWRNRSSSTANDGGYLEEAHMNDIYGFFGALLRNAEIVPDGTVDTARKSQFYEALITVAQKVVSDNPVDLSSYLKKSEIAQEWGDREDVPLSQKFLTDNILGSIFNAKFYGYVGDGADNLLSEFYDSLEDAQDDYPFARSLDQSIDYCAIQKCINITGSCRVTGTGIITDTIIIPDGGTLSGDGYASWTVGFSHLVESGGTTLIFKGDARKEYSVNDISSQNNYINFKNNSYTTANYPNTPTEYYNLTDLTNADAMGVTPATPRMFSVGVYGTGSVGVSSLRMVVNNNGESNYKEQSSMEMGDDWDVGIFCENTNNSKFEDLQIVGYWKIASVLKTNVSSVSGVSASGEFDKFDNVKMQGNASLLIRSADVYNIDSLTSNTITIKFSSGHMFGSTGSLRSGGVDYPYSSVAYNDGNLIFTVQSTEGLRVNSGIVRVQKGSLWGVSGTKFNKCYFGGLYHHSRMMSSNVHLDNNGFISRCLEISGQPMRAIHFDTCTVVSLEDISLFMHNCEDVDFTNTYFEGQYARSEPMGVLDSIKRGARIIATRASTSNVKYGGDTRRLLLNSCTRNYVDMTPSLENYNAERFNDVGYFEPRDMRDDISRFPVTPNEFCDEVIFENSKRIIFKNGNTVTYLLPDGTAEMIDAVTTPTRKYQALIRHYFGNTSEDWYLADSTTFRPVGTGVRDLGSPTNRFKDLYLLNQPTVGSDERIKTNIEEINPVYFDVISKISFKSFNLKNNEEKHFGIIAQDWIKACEDCGVDPHESGVLVGSEKEGYAIRYGELQNLFNAYVLEKLK